ncbi:MAG: Omp28-related outer membrane protein [Bacteroidetes bacterium]|nr:Omp28-related outer membrane protein [Bacteroidota bacterium]
MKISLLTSVCLLASGIVFAQSPLGNAQLPVSTATQNKKVVLEEFTGTGCTWCPDGHKRADELVAANNGNVFVINIHAGSFAGNNPDYKTPFGTALDAQTSRTGYPFGTINRTFFPSYAQNTANPGTAMSRGSWTNAASIIMQETSYLNVAMQSTIDYATRELVVNVEVYYTDDSPESKNFLNIALVQDKIIGPQSGKEKYPEKVVGTEYQHDKMLRHLLTGQWGDEIATTAKGTLFAKEYKYTIPGDLPLNGNNTAVVLEDLRLIAYVTETTQVVVSGNEGPVTKFFLNVKENDDKLKMNIYPNPFKNSATISLDMVNSEEVNIRVYNLLGAEVFNYNKTLDSGMNYVPFDGSNLTDGIYIVKVKVGDIDTTRKLSLVR